MKAEDYPFVEEFVTDSKGHLRKVVLQLEDYQRLIEVLEEQGLHRAMQFVKGETPLSLDAALRVIS